jgi:hypothetical protein
VWATGTRGEGPQNRAKLPGTSPSAAIAGGPRSTEILNLNFAARHPPHRHPPRRRRPTRPALLQPCVSVADSNFQPLDTCEPHSRHCQLLNEPSPCLLPSVSMYACNPPQAPPACAKLPLGASRSALDAAWRLTVCPQVLRWSALGVGVFYGAYHQLSLSARDKMALEKKEWERKESLIRQAKQEWARSHPSEQPKSSGGTFRSRQTMHMAWTAELTRQQPGQTPRTPTPT